MTLSSDYALRMQKSQKVSANNLGQIEISKSSEIYRQKFSFFLIYIIKKFLNYDYSRTSKILTGFYPRLFCREFKLYSIKKF